ncbi:hypothetical protein NCC49_002359 [Naganishia albida]|nr:hypothetical protein NCC49_002359 [Naganishia albida]
MSLDPENDVEDNAQNGATDMGNPIPDSSTRQEFPTTTPRKSQVAQKTYKNVSKRRDKAAISAKASSEVNEELSEVDEPMDEVPVAKPRITKRQLSKTTVREPTRLSARSRRVPAEVQAESKASATEPEGSDLTDIGEENEGKDDKDAVADKPKSGRSRRTGKAGRYAGSDSEGTEKAPKQKVKAAGKGKKSASVIPDEADDAAEHSESSLSSLGGSAVDDADAAEGRQPSSKRKAPVSKRKVGGKASTVKSKAAAEDDVPNGTEDSETSMHKEGNEPAQRKPRERPPKKAAADGTAKKSVSKRAIASSSTTARSPKKKAAGKVKGKAQAQPQSSTQLSDAFLQEVFGDSQPKPTKKPLPSDTESSSDEDEHQKVLRLFDTTRHTPQKRKQKMEDKGREKKRKKGVSRESATSGSSESEAEPEDIEFRRDLSALDGAYVYCRNGRLGLYFGGVVVGYDDLSALPPVKKKKFKHGIYLIRLPVEDDKVFRKRRDEFYTEDDEEFATCKLGETAPEATEETSDARTRLSTPPLPADLDSTPFADLDHVVQLRAIRPHLERVIREEYAPAQQRIDRFWYQGKDRSFVQWHGNISAHVIDEIFVPELTRWAVRPPIKRSAEANGAMSESVTPARPVGSKRFEALDDDEREFFVQKILVNEAIIHICLKSEKLEELELEALVAEWADEDMYPEETDVERKTVLMRDLLAKKELDRLAHEEPDVYSIWASLMETRNRKRTEMGLPLEGEKEEEKPIKEKGGRAARSRNNVSYRE